MQDLGTRTETTSPLFDLHLRGNMPLGRSNAVHIGSEKAVAVMQGTSNRYLPIQE